MNEYVNQAYVVSSLRQGTFVKSQAVWNIEGGDSVQGDPIILFVITCPGCDVKVSFHVKPCDWRDVIEIISAVS
jgi:hypothetical protein